MKIYTKTGDQGETGLCGGIRVAKHHECIEAVGALDEFNAAIGLVLAMEPPDAIAAVLRQVQHDLFDLGGHIATAYQENSGTFSGDSRVGQLESEIDLMESELTPLESFVMPGGRVVGSHLHWLRTVCRRVERRIAPLLGLNTEQDFSQGLVLLNRLSDYLFVAARWCNQRDGVAEVTWAPRKPSR